MRFVTPLIFSFVYILQLADDLWPHLWEGSEKQRFPGLSHLQGFQDFESPTSLNLCHCKQLRFPDYRLFSLTHNSLNNSKTHSSKTLGQRVPANPEIVIVSSGKGLN